jgi:hypothetical protein
MNLENIMLERAGKKTARDIDAEIINDMVIDMLTKDGWTQTKINPAFDKMPTSPLEMTDWYRITGQWIQSNAQGKFRLLKGQWLFEDPRDATMFILRWS